MKINDFLKIDYFINKKIMSAQKLMKRQRTFKSFKDIKSIAILFNINDWVYIEQIVQDLKQHKKEVTAWTVKQKTENHLVLPEYVKVIDPGTDTSWQQTINQNIVDLFEKQQYDTLFDFSSSDDQILTYLLMINKSNLCIGITESQYQAYDFVILKENNANIFETYNQIKFYLDNMFKSSNNS
ncbi:MAG: DUF6913 domain-containing protein [Dysgonomonas sp.]